MHIDYRLSIYFVLLVLSVFFSLKQRSYLRTSDKWISYLLLLTIISEAIALYLKDVYKNNMPLYHVYSPMELLFICLYFNERIPGLKKQHVGLIVGCVGILLAGVNAAFLQSPLSINSVFLMYEGFSVIALSLYSFYRLMMDEEEIIRNSHFWFTALLLIYWSFVFFYWGMYAYFLTSLKVYFPVVGMAFDMVNILTYAGFALVFIRYRKLAAISE
jgi:hypothetical protein